MNAMQSHMQQTQKPIFWVSFVLPFPFPLSLFLLCTDGQRDPKN